MLCRVSGKIAKYTTLTQLIKVFNCQLKIHLCFFCSSRIDSNENTIPFVFEKPSIAEI